jgi:hypothetical protein
MTLILERTGDTTGDFEWMSSRSEAVSENQTRPAPITNPTLKDALRMLNSVEGEILAPIYTRLALADCSSQDLPTNFVQVAGGTNELVKANALRLFFDDRHALELSVWVCASASETVLGHQILGDSPSKFLTSESADPADVLLDLSRRLGLPMEQVLAAADIPSSTFYLWKKSGRAMRPRLASHRRLWELVQFVEDAEEIVGSSLQQWLLARPERRELLLAGEFAALLKRSVGDTVAAQDYSRDLSMYAVGGASIEPQAPLSPSPSRLGKRPGTIRRATSRPKG